METVLADHALAIETVMVNGACGEVELQVYETGNGGYFAIDGSWLENESDNSPLYIQSPFDKGYSIQLIDKMSEKDNSCLSIGDGNNELVAKVLETLLTDIDDGDTTVLEEALQFLPSHVLQGIISE